MTNYRVGMPANGITCREWSKQLYQTSLYLKPKKALWLVQLLVEQGGPGSIPTYSKRYSPSQRLWKSRQPAILKSLSFYTFCVFGLDQSNHKSFGFAAA